MPSLTEVLLHKLPEKLITLQRLTLETRNHRSPTRSEAQVHFLLYQLQHCYWISFPIIKCSLIPFLSNVPNRVHVDCCPHSSLFLCYQMYILSPPIFYAHGDTWLHDEVVCPCLNEFPDPCAYGKCKHKCAAVSGACRHNLHTGS